MITKASYTSTTTMSVSAPTNQSSSAQAPRPRNRKKAAPEPEALYRGDISSLPAAAQTPATTGSKRQAQDRAEDEPRKRKRVNVNNSSSLATTTFQTQTPTSTTVTAMSAPGQGSKLAGRQQEGETPVALLEFTTLPTTSLYKYAIQYDLVPIIYPTPLSADDPPPPAALLDPARMASRAPSPAPMTTPANRPQRRSRESKEASRRRSSRLLEEESRTELEQTPVLNDVREMHGVLATLAARHFRETNVREVDTLAAFMCAVKARTSGRWK